MLFDACYQAKESVDKFNKTPLDYAKEFDRKDIIEFARNTTHLLYNIDQQQQMEELASNRKSKRHSRPVTVRDFNLQTSDFKRIAQLGKGSYASVFLV